MHEIYALEQSSGDYLRESIENSFKELKSDFESKEKSEVVQRISKLGFKTFE